jgi:hypothetical protein
MALQSLLLGAFSLLIAIAASAAPTAVAPQAQLPTLVVEIIRGVFLVIAAIGAVFAKEIYDTRSLTSLSSARRKAVTGTWTGTAANLPVPDDQPLMMKFDITFHFTARRKVIKGKAVFHRDRDYEVTLRGGFYGDRHLKIEYLHRPPILAFGYIIFALNDEATEMNGKVVAYGAKSQKIVVGTVGIQKA